jgi:hypothetical protein
MVMVKGYPYRGVVTLARRRYRAQRRSEARAARGRPRRGRAAPGAAALRSARSARSAASRPGGTVRRTRAGSPSAPPGATSTPERLERAGLRELVEAELRLELGEQRLGAGPTDGVAAAQAGEPPRLRKRAEHEQPRVVGEQSERGVARLGVDEVAQRLVEQDHDALGQRLEQRGEIARGNELARRGRLTAARAWGRGPRRAAATP